MSRIHLMQLKDTAILAGNASLRERFIEKPFTIRVLSNMTVTPVKEILEYELRRAGISALVELSDYNDISRSSLETADVDAVAIFWDLANLVECLSSKALVTDVATIEEIEKKTQYEIDLLLHNLRHVRLVLFNTFSSLIFNAAELNRNELDRLADSLNAHLRSAAPKNVFLIDLDKCIARVSVEKAVDWRMWLSARLLYSTALFKSYASFAAPVFKALTGKAKKALIFDCDNTLWKGIIGEDGLERIAVSPCTKEGQPFYEVQTLALALVQRGVILGLCSKNNPADVEEVLERHPGMVLRNEHFSIKRVNWNDKVENLEDISRTLNIGLDSLVYVDDSEFEASLVEQFLPQVEVLRVPKSTSEYPHYFRDQMNLFWRPKGTDEDLKRTHMYKLEVARQQERPQFRDLQEYLTSLNLVLTVYRDRSEFVTRIAQLTQKTNQFNLTTRRYSEAEIQAFVSSPQWLVYAFALADRFGDFGVTGVALLRLDPRGCTAELDTLLLSCRVLGRNVEIKFFDFIVEQLRQQGVATLTGKYVATAKNAQVADFFEARGFQLVKQDDKAKEYRLKMSDYPPTSIDYIQVQMGGK